MHVEHRINEGWERHQKMSYYHLRKDLKDPTTKMYKDISAELSKVSYKPY